MYLIPTRQAIDNKNLHDTKVVTISLVPHAFLQCNFAITPSRDGAYLFTHLTMGDCFDK